MRLPRIAIVGRPNVGKSTLFNFLRDKERGARRPQIVSSIARTTRDLREAAGRLGELKFKVLDTAGYENRDDNPDSKQSGSFEGISHAMAARTTAAIKIADAVVLLLDGKEGITGMDYETADWLRKTAPPTARRIACFNKCEGDRYIDPDDERAAMSFASRGEDVLRISAVHGDGMPTFLDRLRSTAVTGEEDEEEEEAEEEKEIRVALVGRANVGKSTILNALARDEISLMAQTPGVTRDAVEALLDFEQRKICLVDTAGLRRNQACDVVDRNSIAGTRRELRSCDVAILVVDCSESLQREDRRLAAAALEADALVVVVNKLDRHPGTAQEVEDYMRAELFRGRHFTGHAVISCSALDGPARARRALHFAVAAHDANHKRLSTGKLNSWFADWLKGPQGDLVKGVRYLTQISTNPPCFGIWGRGLKQKLSEDVLRAIERALRADFDFKGARVRLVFRGDRLALSPRRPAKGAIPQTKKFGKRTRHVRLGKNRNKDRQLKALGVDRPLNRWTRPENPITGKDVSNKDRYNRA